MSRPELSLQGLPAKEGEEMKRPSATAKISPEVRAAGLSYVKLTAEEVPERERLRREIKAEGILAAHVEYLKRLPARMV